MSVILVSNVSLNTQRTSESEGRGGAGRQGVEESREGVRGRRREMGGKKEGFDGGKNHEREGEDR